MIADRLGFRCEIHSSSCDPYFCVKVRSGLVQDGKYTQPSSAALTVLERMLVGWLPSAGPPSRLMYMLADDEERSAEAEARLRGLRYLLQIGDGERHEVSA